MKGPAVALIFVICAGGIARAQEQDPAAPAVEPTTRTEAIEQAQTEKAGSLVPAAPDKAEAYVTRISDMFLAGQMKWHGFFHNAYSGGGFGWGAGYTWFVSPYNTVDLRGSITRSGYKRIEAEFIAPGLFGRRGTLNAIGGWREATEVGFYGLGLTSTQENRANYSFKQPFARALLEVHPTRNRLMVAGGLEVTQWNQADGSGSYPSIETVYSPETLPGLNAQPVYLHSQATVGVDSREAAGYARRGGFYGVTFHDYTDKDSLNGFQQVDYEAIQHIPFVREAWVVSLHGLLSTSYSKSGQQIPFYMMPALGGGDDLRAYSSWRLRDLNSLLVQAEWRAPVNRFLDMAVFWDTGRVAPRLDAMKLGDLKHDGGIGIRFHGPTLTVLRVDLAKGSEGWGLVFASSTAF